MKKITIAFLLVAFSLPSMAQKLDWNIHYDYLLSNYEYDRSNNIYDDSYTLHAARLSPELGFLVHQGKCCFITTLKPNWITAATWKP